MNLRAVSALVFSVALAASVYAQQAAPPPPDGQTPSTGQGQGMGRGRWGGGMGMGGPMGMIGRGVAGTVTEVAVGHYTIKTFQGETYTIHYSANTRIMKQQPGGRGMGEGRRQGRGQAGAEAGRGEQGAGNPPQIIKASDIKVGDAIAAMGDQDDSARSVGAVGIVLLDPERAKQMQQMEADYGKTWLMGRVTAIDGVKLTLAGGPGQGQHSFVCDENTTFRKRRDPIALTDIQVGDMVRVEGGLKSGAFTATAVSDMGVPNQDRGPRNAPPQ